MLSPKRKTLLAILLAILGLAVLAAAYDWYRGRYQRTVLFDASGLRLPPALAGPGPIRLVHFHDPACPCNVGNQQHLAELIERYGARGVSFHAVQRPGSRGGLPPALAALQPLAALPDGKAPPASPALAIWDRQGHLAYFGPYSEGATCTSANSFVEPILDALLEGRPVRAGGTLAEGCFCDWR
ncbi:DUF6436 domain-containing protein [Azotobacter vinelandii]|uniref:DUF6436 domain-containing protein n=1 Tax=Azotobacter vinelandii TaxID=354 RepID=UPI0007740AAD|nr:DUF6436 domain-containing protein [Azotobacter vinelandii]WKN21735.1 DUF6436 domain-containing protein [Azotobacter vinelandii]